MSQTPQGTTSMVASLTLERLSDTRWRAPSVFNDFRPTVFGGQLMGQMIVAAAQAQPAKRVKSLHAVFCRVGTVAKPVDLEVASLHDGRALGTISVTAWQDDRLLSTGLLLMDTGEPDVIRHQSAMPSVAGPDQLTPRDHAEEGSEIRIVDSVDTMNAALTGPPELNVWVQFSATTPEQAVHQALLSWWTDPFLIGAAMRPHEGIGEDQSHETLSTGVLTHTLTFHEPIVANDWHLLTQQSVFAGNGRTYGTGNVFTQGGRLVASFSQDNMIRYFRDEAGVRGKSSAAM